MNQLQTFITLAICDVFSFQDGRTIFVGNPVESIDEAVFPCHGELHIGELSVKHLTVYPELFFSSSESPELKAIGTRNALSVDMETLRNRIDKAQCYLKLGIYSHYSELLTSKPKISYSKRLWELIDTTKTPSVNISRFSKNPKNHTDVWNAYLSWFKNIGLDDFVHRSDYAENISKLDPNVLRRYNANEVFAKNFGTGN